MKRALLLCIRLYQKYGSPAKGRSTCRFYPTCSTYAVQAITRYGAIRGSFKAIKRILKCHPCHKGGYDPLV